MDRHLQNQNPKSSLLLQAVHFILSMTVNIPEPVGLTHGLRPGTACVAMSHKINNAADDNSLSNDLEEPKRNSRPCFIAMQHSIDLRQDMCVPDLFMLA